MTAPLSDQLSNPLPDLEAPDLDLDSKDDDTPCILVAQDDADARREIVGWLTAAGYDVRICDNGKKVMDMIHIVMPSLLILDIMKPPGDSLEICRQLRQSTASPLASRLPIIVLRSEPDEIDETVYLEVGADDYVGKPVHRRLLVAHVRALLRRVSFTLAGVTPDQAYVSSGDLALDLVTRRATRAKDPLTLTPKEFDLLALFMTHRGQVFTRDEILSRVWREKPKESSTSLRVHLHWLRDKIESNPAEPVRLRTLAGRGYVFVG